MPHSSASDVSLTGDELLSEVGAAAAELVAALEDAQQRTADWTDEPLADSLVNQVLSQCLARLSRTGCWGRANQTPSSELWKIAGETLEVGRLQARARFKPLGYAGDYQMLAWICHWTCCDHPLGQFFDRYFQRQAAPEAVRGRTQMAAAAIAARCGQHAGPAFHVVSVGVGPGLDLLQAVQKLDEPRRRTVRVTLVDLDEAGLEFAAEPLRRILPPQQVVVLRENLFRLARRPQAAAQLSGADFLLCTGLFDYLDDATAAELLQRFWQWLSPTGELLVGNFAPHCPTRAYMEWLGNWYLTYRTKEELSALADAAGIPIDRRQITAERLGVDYFLAARK